MPARSRFLGISIFISYRDHNPPHFHAKYQEHEASTVIVENKILIGQLSPRVLSLVIEWSAINKVALLKNWENDRNKKVLEKIEPLV